MSALSGVGTSSCVEDCDVARPPSEMIFGVTLDRFFAEHFTAVRARATGALVDARATSVVIARGAVCG